MSREALEGSTLSDLHSIAAELDIDGYRRMRKGELIAAILGEEYTGEEPEVAEAEEEEVVAPAPDRTQLHLHRQVEGRPLDDGHRVAAELDI
ncbi:MAG: Rho termination factor N-terminal domain-containing protein, partial [Solirubrobacterales bacterium]